MPVGKLARHETAGTVRDGKINAGHEQESETEIMFADDDRPKPKKLHEIGCDLTFLSADELEERIRLLHDEIARLEADKAAKTSSRSAAETFFKSK